MHALFLCFSFNLSSMDDVGYCTIDVASGDAKYTTSRPASPPSPPPPSPESIFEEGEEYNVNGEVFIPERKKVASTLKSCFARGLVVTNIGIIFFFIAVCIVYLIFLKPNIYMKFPYSPCRLWSDYIYKQQEPNIVSLLFRFCNVTSVKIDDLIMPDK